MESQKAETSRFALNDSSDLGVANRRSSGFLRDRQLGVERSRQISVKAHYFPDVIQLTDRKVQYIPCGEGGIFMDQVAGMQDGFSMNRKNLFHTLNSQIQRSVQGLQTFYRQINMDQLLYNLCRGHKPLFLLSGLQEKALSLFAQGVGLAYGIDKHIAVDKDHDV